MNSYINIMSHYYIICIKPKGDIVIFPDLCCITLEEAQELTVILNYAITLVAYKHIYLKYSLSTLRIGFPHFIKNNKLNIKIKKWTYKYSILNTKFIFTHVRQASKTITNIIYIVSLKLACIKFIFENKEMFKAKFKLLPLELRNIFEMKFIKY